MTWYRDTKPRERLLAKLVPQPNGCWHWTGVVDRKGYGHVGYKGKRGESLQRAVYDCFVGPIPDGHDVDHTCHNKDLTCVRLGAKCMHRRCGNPAHLTPIPRVENGQIAKARITYCPANHEYTEENTYIFEGRRFCKTCQRIAGKISKANARMAQR